jgi:GntR family transcriptional regulator/MocR family aminotransferase
MRRVRILTRGVDQFDSQSQDVDQSNSGPYPASVDLHVSLVGRRDLAGEIYRSVRGAILDGRVRRGERLPATRELAVQLGVSRTTVAAAYDRLISEGYATARVGSGTFVEAGDQPVDAPPDGARPARTLTPRAIWESIPLPTVFDREAAYDFRAGLPDVRLFPFDTWRRLLARELRPAAVGRGIYGSAAGHRGLREAIARHIGLSRGVRASADGIVVTNGTQQAVDIVARVLLGPRDRVAVEEPGYPLIRWLLDSLGARVATVPVDREGLVVDAIPPDTRLVYVSPSHQFPLGMSMSLARRRALLAWAQRHDAAIIEDDYDSEFRFGGRPIDALQTLDTSGRVIYVGTFSKTMLPTLRLGFAVLPASLWRAGQVAKHLADWHTSLPMQAALAHFIDDGLFARHVRRMRSVYQSRHELIVQSLDQTLASELEVVPSSVGLHLSALACGASHERIGRVVRRAEELGVACHPLSAFAARDDTRPGIVLGYGAIAMDRIEAGLHRLGQAFAETA